MTLQNKSGIFILLALPFFLLPGSCHQQTDTCTGVQFFSSDARIKAAFDWAKAQALAYVGDSADPVGPWYEAALPGREAFCMRDVSHQCIGAEVLGLSQQNRNMMLKIAAAISESKDWCSFWEINRYNQPAPADYRNDSEFWYNLPANFDVTDACLRLYRWTGDTTWLDDPALQKFYRLSLGTFVEHWQLQPAEIMSRSRFLHVPQPFDPQDAFHVCRGLPSYVESVTDLQLGADLPAVEYAAFRAGAEMALQGGHDTLARYYLITAKELKNIVNRRWWDEESGRFNMFLFNDGHMQPGEGTAFLLRSGIVEPGLKTGRTLAGLTSQKKFNIETRSYLPMIFFDHDLDDEAYRQILILSDSTTPRREYPEVSFAVVESIVAGWMGIEPDAAANLLITRSHLDTLATASISCLPLLQSSINVEHQGRSATKISMTKEKKILWKACFDGRHSTLFVNGDPVAAGIASDATGKIISFVQVPLKSGQAVRVSVER